MVPSGLPGPDKQVGRVLWPMGTIRTLFLSGFKAQVASGRIRESLVKPVGTHSTASLINLLGGRLGRSGMRPYQPLADAQVAS
jgi:hypothetical protein